MKPNNYIVGSWSILAVSFLMLAVQFSFMWQFYENKGPSLVLLTCVGGPPVPWEFHCMFPRWLSLISIGLHCICVLASVAAHKQLGRKWWYGVLPLVSLIAVVIFFGLTPMVYIMPVR